MACSTTTASLLTGANGHYTLDVLHQNSRGDTIGFEVTGIGGGSGSEMWLHIDNEMVSSVRHEDIFEHGNGTKRSDNHCAHLPFY